MSRAWLCAIVLLLASHSATAAGECPGLSGAVSAASGEPAPLAELTLVNLDSGVETQVVADRHGKYQILRLPAGRYAVTARAAHTSVSTRAGVVVTGGPCVELSIILSTMPAVLESGGLREVPLNGRNYLDLLSAVSDATRGGEGGDIEGFGPYAPRGNLSLNSYGQRGQNNNFLIDGMDNNESWLRGPMLSTSTEAVESVSLLATYIPAELGHATGAAVSARSRTGSNRVHASLFEYVQSSISNARNFFDGPKKPSLAQNQFGGNLSGPVRKDNWFVSLNADLSRERRGLTVISTVPTALQKTGVFGPLSISDPATITEIRPVEFQRQPFPGNLIPPARIPAQARRLIALYPDPNLPGVVNNYRFTPSLVRHDDRLDVRSDKVLSTRGTLFARASYERHDTRSPGALPGPPGSFAGSDAAQHADAAHTRLTVWSGVVSHTIAVRPSLVNEFRAGIARIDQTGSALDAGLDAAAALGIPGLGLDGLPAGETHRLRPAGSHGAGSFSDSRDELPGG